MESSDLGSRERGAALKIGRSALKPRRGTRTVHSPKSRTGCSTCKTKRFKCDETQPECQNCVKYNLRCPGYHVVPKWHAKHQTDVRTFNPSTGKKEKKKKKEHGGSVTSPAGRNEELPQAIHVEDNTDINLDYMDSLDQCEVPLDMPILDTDEIFAFDQVDLLSDNPASNSGSELCTNVASLPSPSQLSSQAWDDVEWLFCEGVTPAAPTSVIHTKLGLASTNMLSNEHPKSTRGLLRKFYQTASSVPPSVTNHSTRLVEYYFSTICGVFSCFDSCMNPFRYFVGNAWKYSGSIYYAIQSMAAAHLGNDIPYVRRDALELQQKASNMLKQELHSYRAGQSDAEAPFLSLLLLGLSACWHQPSDLGSIYLKLARQLVYPGIFSGNKVACGTSQPLLKFCEEAMVYWEMVNSFVADDTRVQDWDSLAPEYCESGIVVEPQDQHPSCEIVQEIDLSPHPWTGVNPQSQMLLAEVGRLIRRVRVSKSSISPAEATQGYELALDLEEQLLACCSEAGSPDMSREFLRTEDDLLILSAVTRDCGLLEIYRVFPDILQRRLHKKGKAVAPQIGTDSFQLSLDWLTAEAIRILKQLERIPSSSYVKAHQLLPLLITAAELRFSFHEPYQSTLSELHLGIGWARRFTKTRLECLATQIPAKPVRTVLALLNEVWLRLDTAISLPSDIFWIDVMVEKDLHTIPG